VVEPRIATAKCAWQEKERAMFETSMLASPARRRALSLGYVIEGILLGLVVLFPLIHTEALPSGLISNLIINAPPPPGALAQRAPVRKAVRVSMRDLMAAPVTIPNRIVPLSEQPERAVEPPTVGLPGSVPWGDPHGLPDGFGRAVLPPPPPRRAPAVARLPVGGVVEASRLVFQAQPEYPQIARMARVQGTVRLAAIITKDGAIASLQVLSGPPLLIKAALDAVSRWRYQPTLLDGEPVEVSTEIDVNFVLGE
jgi:protein TonB